MDSMQQQAIEMGRLEKALNNAKTDTERDKYQKTSVLNCS